MQLLNIGSREALPIQTYSKYCQSNILHGKNTFSLQLQKNKGEHFGRKRDCYTLQTSNARLPKCTSTYICTMLLLISFKTSCNCCCSFLILLLKSLFFCEHESLVVDILVYVLYLCVLKLKICQKIQKYYEIL